MRASGISAYQPPGRRPNSASMRILYADRIDSIVTSQLHLSVPVLGLRIRRPEDLEVPFAPAPGLDDLRRHDVDEDLGERPSFRIAFEVVGGLVPPKVGIDHHRQEQ